MTFARGRFHVVTPNPRAMLFAGQEGEVVRVVTHVDKCHKVEVVLRIRGCEVSVWVSHFNRILEEGGALVSREGCPGKARLRFFPR